MQSPGRLGKLAAQIALAPPTEAIMAYKIDAPSPKSPTPALFGKRESGCSALCSRIDLKLNVNRGECVSVSASDSAFDEARGNRAGEWEKYRMCRKSSSA